MKKDTISLEMDLDELDRMLIRELEVDARQSTRDLGRKLDVSATTISNRLRRMSDKGIIAFAAVTDPGTMGFHVQVFIGLTVGPGKSAEVTQHLIPCRSIQWLTASTGRYDMVAYALFRSFKEMLDWMTNDLGTMGAVINADEMIVLRRVRSLYGHSNAECQGPGEVTGPCLDELDLNLIGELELNPRESIGVLAKKIGASPWVTSRKLKMLQAEKITQIVSIIDPRARGVLVRTLTLVRTHLDAIVPVTQTLAANPRIVYVGVIAGPYNIIVAAYFRNVDEMSHFLSHELGGLPGVTGYETMVMIGSQYHDYHLKL
ncbi:MAG: Lrp/AsnC family transcriptional regulator [Dehalococcoidia bacterium]